MRECPIKGKTERQKPDSTSFGNFLFPHGPGAPPAISGTASAVTTKFAKPLLLYPTGFRRTASVNRRRIREQETPGAQSLGAAPKDHGRAGVEKFVNLSGLRP
jgi:hypothetical protein